MNQILQSSQCDLSIVIVSFNTRDLLRNCLQTVVKEAGEVLYEIIVIDNASRDQSAEMVAAEFPQVRLIRSEVNLGFGAANNRGFAVAQGRYVVLLNSDAFLTPDALVQAMRLMDARPEIGLAGVRLVGRDDGWQPSARSFPSVLNHFLTISGLSAKYPHSRFFGRVDRTWANPLDSAVVDWVPGAFAIIRREVLATVGVFDERFFLYYEEVDLCRRIQAAGYQIYYLADVRVIHLGGESSKSLTHQHSLSSAGKQIILWQLRSTLLYYRKHYGFLHTGLWMLLDYGWHRLRAWRNGRRAPQKAAHLYERTQLLMQAWRETQGGKVSPPRPW